MAHRNILLVPILTLAWFVAGCGISTDRIEQAVKEGMKSQMNVVVKSIEIKKQADGSFLGTATAENGDVYDVTTQPPKDNKVEWKAIPGQNMVEKTVREGLEQQLKTQVKSLQLTRKAPGDYNGPAELASGDRVIISTRIEAGQLKWEAKPATP